MKRLMILGFLALPASADVDVAVTAGSPLEWLQDVPKPIVSMDRTTTKRARGSTVMLEDGVAPQYQNTDLFNYFRVRTVDLVGEIPWATIKSTQPGPLYPPQMTTDVYWQAIIVYLRRVLHPSEVSEGEAIQYLIYLGEPSRMAAEAARGDGTLGAMTSHIFKTVAAMPNKAPLVPETGDAYETMMLRITYEDLTSSYPFSMSTPFAPRISLMGDEAVPFVIQAAESNHSFLRQNAVLWLGQSDNGRAHAALREIFPKTTDPVVRNRCLESFARRRDRAHVELLIKQLRESTDMSYRCYLAYVLGRIGDPRARPVIAEILENNKNSFDFSCSALAALARFGWTDDLAIRKVVAHFKNNPPAGDIQSRYQPNTPDPPGTRRQIQKQLALIAETQIKGDEPSRAALVKIAGELRQPCMYLAIETLSTFPEGRQVLKDWIEKDSDVTVKAFATAKLAASSTPDTIEFFKKIATIDSPQPVCEIALRTLETADRNAAIECARAIVRQATRRIDPGRRYIVSLACKLLVAHKKIDASRIVELIENDMIVSEACVLQLNTMDATEFTTQVPAIEQMVIELGELKDPKAIPMLLDILRSPNARGRAEACVALGKIGGREALLHLIDFAEDTANGWVRFVAARVVSEIARRDFRCDWINGEPEKRAKVVKQMREWAEGLK